MAQKGTSSSLGAGAGAGCWAVAGSVSDTRPVKANATSNRRRVFEAVMALLLVVRFELPDRRLAGPGPTLSLVLEPEQTPGGALAPRDLLLVLPREHPHPAQERQAPAHLAAGVDPHRAVDELHTVQGQPHPHRVVEREHREQLLTQPGLGHPRAAVLLGDVGQHTAG